MLELYHALISTCSQNVRLVLAEKKLEWASRLITLDAGEHLSPQYLKINPNGVVPTLVDGGDAVTDSSVINEYLDDVYPAIPVRPGNPKTLAQMRAWRQYIDEVPTPAIRVPSFNAFFVPQWSGMTDGQFFDFTEKLPLRKHFFRKMGKTGFGEADMAEALDKLGQLSAGSMPHWLRGLGSSMAIILSPMSALRRRSSAWRILACRTCGRSCHA